MSLTIRNEETKRSVAYQVPAVRDDGQGVIVSMLISVQCQVPGTRDNVERTLSKARLALEAAFTDASA